MMGVAKQAGGKRQTVAIHADVAGDFLAACKGRAVGRSMNDAATRIVRWFVKQPQPVQTAVTSDVDQGMEAHYAAVLRKLADELDERARGVSDPGHTPRIPPEKPGVVYSDKGNVVRVTDELDAEERERTVSARRKR